MPAPVGVSDAATLHTTENPKEEAANKERTLTGFNPEKHCVTCFRLNLVVVPKHAASMGHADASLPKLQEKVKRLDDS